MIRRPPRSPLFPYPTLSRSLAAGYELYIARRHVSIFRPGLLLGAFAVLIFGILPPLLIYGILRAAEAAEERTRVRDRKSTRLNSSHLVISYAVFCLKKKKLC